MSSLTCYETQPVSSIPQGISELIAAFNRLEDALGGGGADFSFALRAAFAKGVPLEGGMQISPYEIGIAAEAAPPGKYGTNLNKLRRALEKRPAALRELFNCAEHGLLPRLLHLCADFRTKNAPDDGAPNVYWENVYPPLMRFVNECRRMQAFW